MRAGLDDAGFTLVELLVAFSITALMLTALFQLFSRSLDGVGRAEMSGRALQLAESRLALLGIAEPLTAGATAGRFDELFAWQQETAIAAAQGARRLFQVRLTVSWRQGVAPRSLSLETMRLATAPGAAP